MHSSGFEPSISVIERLQT